MTHDDVRIEVRDALLSARRMVFRLALIAAILLVLERLFWFGADFRTFEPPSDGSFEERLHYAVMTAAGPFAMFMKGGFSALEVMVWLPVLLAMMTASVIWRRRRANRIAGYVAVFLWFFQAFTVAALRIT